MFNYSVDITLISLRYLNSPITSTLFTTIYVYIIFSYDFKSDQGTPKDSI